MPPRGHNFDIWLHFFPLDPLRVQCVYTPLFGIMVFLQVSVTKGFVQAMLHTEPKKINEAAIFLHT